MIPRCRPQLHGCQCTLPICSGGQYRNTAWPMIWLSETGPKMITDLLHDQALILVQVGFHALSKDEGGLGQKQVNEQGDHDCGHRRAQQIAHKMAGPSQGRW